jgi:hypothetical protein
MKYLTMDTSEEDCMFFEQMLKENEMPQFVEDIAIRGGFSRHSQFYNKTHYEEFSIIERLTKKPMVSNSLANHMPT